MYSMLRRHGWVIGTLCLFASSCISLEPEVIVHVKKPLPTPSPVPSASPALVTRTVTNIDISQTSPTPSPLEPSASVVSSEPVVPVPTPVATLLPSPAQPPLPTPTPSPVPLPVPTPTPIFIYVSSGYSGGSSGGPVPTPTPITVTTTKIAGTETSTLTRGETRTLYASVNFSDGTVSQAVSWSSSDSAVASITAQGLVTANETGTVMLTARAAADNNKSASLTLTVVKPTVSFEGRISYLSGDDIYLMNGDNQNPLRLTSNGATQEKVWPRLSWGGEQIAYRILSNDIVVVNSNGTGSPVLRDLPATDLSPMPYFWYNDEILYQDYDTNANLRNVWRIKPDGTIQGWSNILGGISGPIGGVTPAGVLFYEQAGHVKSCKYNNIGSLVDYGVGFDVRIAKNAAPSLIVYNDGHDDIMTSSLAGVKTNLTQTPEYEGQPALSPDESKIVFVSRRDNGSKDIYIMNVDGTNIQNLTHTPNIDEVEPDWSN